MLDHSGKLRIRYEDALRAVGHYLDNHHFIEVVLVETPEGFLIKGQILPQGGSSDAVHTYPETYLFSNEDIDVLLENAYGRRSR